MTKEFRISDIESFKDVMRVLHCPIRWDIIEVLKSGPKSDPPLGRPEQSPRVSS